MHVRVDQRWRVTAHVAIDLPMSPSAVWPFMRDLTRFIAMDPLHARVTVIPRRGSARSGSSPAGAHLIIAHRVLGIGPDRVGRILFWREGRGFAFSDLSRRGVRTGFPHVCLYELAPADAASCRLIVGARGLWTARWLPRWAVKLWIAWVMLETQRCLRSAARRWRRIAAAR
jgi:hypothetical protein